MPSSRVRAELLAVPGLSLAVGAQGVGLCHERGVILIGQTHLEMLEPSEVLREKLAQVWVERRELVDGGARWVAGRGKPV